MGILVHRAGSVYPPGMRFWIADMYVALWVKKVHISPILILYKWLQHLFPCCADNHLLRLWSLVVQTVGQRYCLSELLKPGAYFGFLSASMRFFSLKKPLLAAHSTILSPVIWRSTCSLAVNSRCALTILFANWRTVDSFIWISIWWGVILKPHFQIVQKKKHNLKKNLLKKTTFKGLD